MTNNEHLQKIKAKCQQLLDIAAKRQLGTWAIDNDNLIAGDRYVLGVTFDEHVEGASNWPIVQQNRAFIASCAGPAEAGWKATIAAINDWTTLFASTEGFSDGAPDASDHDKLCNEISSIARINIRYILSAWPIELLSQP